MEYIYTTNIVANELTKSLIIIKFGYFVTIIDIKEV